MGSKKLHLAALGSSFAAGPSIAPEIDPVAKRSGNNYPHLLAKALNADLTDLSSSGATLLNVLDEPQQLMTATRPPQLNGLPADVDIVTLTGGGNDMGYSGSMIADAGRATIDDEDLLDAILETLGLPPGAKPAAATPSETTQRFVNVINAVKAKAPQAKIYLVEYLAVFGPETKVTDEQPIPEDKVKVHMQRADELRQAYRDAAAQTGVACVPISDLSESHALGSKEPWITGYTKEMFMKGDAPYHPNAAGHVAVAKELEQRIQQA